MIFVTDYIFITTLWPCCLGLIGHSASLLADSPIQLIAPKHKGFKIHKTMFSERRDFDSDFHLDFHQISPDLSGIKPNLFPIFLAMIFN